MVRQEVPAQEARQESPGPGSQAGRPGPGSRAGREGPLRGASPGLDVGRQEVLTLSGRKSWPRKPGRKGRPYEGGFTRTGQYNWTVELNSRTGQQNWTVELDRRTVEL